MYEFNKRTHRRSNRRDQQQSQALALTWRHVIVNAAHTGLCLQHSLQAPKQFSSPITAKLDRTLLASIRYAAIQLVSLSLRNTQHQVKKLPGMASWRLVVWSSSAEACSSNCTIDFASIPSAALYSPYRKRIAAGSDCVFFLQALSPNSCGCFS